VFRDSGAGSRTSLKTNNAAVVYKDITVILRFVPCAWRTSRLGPSGSSRTHSRARSARATPNAHFRFLHREEGNRNEAMFICNLDAFPSLLLNSRTPAGREDVVKMTKQMIGHSQVYNSRPEAKHGQSISPHIRRALESQESRHHRRTYGTRLCSPR